MIIRKAEEGRFEEIRGFYHSLIDAMAGATAYVGWKKDIYPSPEFLAESIKNGEMYYIAENGRIAAAMVLSHEYNEGYRRFHWQTEASDDEILVIHALGVHPDFGRMGYAKAMVREAIRLAEETGMKAIRLDVLEGNIPAEHLYTGFGFQYMATLKMYYEDTGWTNFMLYEYVI